jgi:hypothetical protein
VVRDTKTLDELIERSRDISMLPEQLRAQRRSFAYGNTTISNPNVRARSSHAWTLVSNTSSARNELKAQAGAP